MKTYAGYINLFQNVLKNGVIPEIKATVQDEKEREILLAICNSILFLCSIVYNILHKAYEDAVKNGELDFEVELPSPPPSLSKPTEKDAISWVQLSWGIISSALNAVSASFAGIRVYWTALEAVINKLLDGLLKIFGPPKELVLETTKDPPKDIPAMIDVGTELTQ